MRSYIISISLLAGCICLGSCIQGQFQKKNNYSLKLKLEKPTSKNMYVRNDQLTYIFKNSIKEYQEDTIDIYLNSELLFSKKMNPDRKINIPLKKAQFGENLVEVSLRKNSSYKYAQVVKVYPENKPADLAYTVLDEYEHNPNDFTQGLIVDKDTITESTGGYGSSYLKKYNVKTGEIYQEYALPKEYFAEGVTRFQGKVYLLTYKENKVLIFDSFDGRLLDVKYFFSEGWGITNNNDQLIVSNGTSEIYFLDPETLEIIRSIKVFDNNGEVNKINELEFINEEIYANIWFKDEILIIDPISGAVTKKLDLKSLVKTYKKSILSENVLNGIAYDPHKEVLYITGKRWPVLFKIVIEQE